MALARSRKNGRGENFVRALRAIIFFSPPNLQHLSTPMRIYGHLCLFGFVLSWFMVFCVYRVKLRFTCVQRVV